MAERARAQIAADVAGAQQRAETARQLRQDVANVRGEWSSPSRNMRVIVDQTGRLVDVWFAQSALDGGPERLRAQLLDGSARAGRDAASRVARMAADRLGEDSVAARAVAAEAEERFGPDPAARSRAAAQTIQLAPWMDPGLYGPGSAFGPGSADQLRGGGV